MKTLAVGSSNFGFELSAQSVTLVDLLEWRARVQAERVAYTFLVDGEQEIISLSWSELHRKAPHRAAVNGCWSRRQARIASLSF